MEKLETKLFEAAAKGCIASLKELLKDDPLLLDRVVVNCFYETPLHVAAMLGQIDFAKEIVTIKPQLANALNSQKSSPLHLASAKGHVDVVRALLTVDSRTCLARDRYGLTPLHLAAVKGRVEVMKTLLQAQPNVARLKLYGGENILHLCAKYYELEALKLLVKTIDEPNFINSKDARGNTVLHLAVADKQVETIDFLLAVAALEVNALNLDGKTAMDVLLRSRRDVRDSLIEESLKRAGGFGTSEANMRAQDTNQRMAIRASSPHQDHPSPSSSTRNNSWEGLFKQHDDWLERKRSALMIVASLIATMAFQAGVNPPCGVWQDDKLDSARGDPVPHPRHAGVSVLASNNPTLYAKFYAANTAAFLASLSIIWLLMSGLPIKRRFFLWILMVITWIAITAIVLAYTLSIISFTSFPTERSVLYVIGCSVAMWTGLKALLLIGHTTRLLVKVLRKLRSAAAPENHVAL